MDKMLRLIPITGDDVIESPDGEVNADENLQTADNSSVTQGDKGTTQEVNSRDWKAEYDALAKQSKENISRLQSTLDSKLSAQELAHKKELADLKKQMEEFQLKGMDEEERAKFLNEKSSKEQNEILVENATLKSKLQEQNLINTWKDFAVNTLGISPDKLVIDQGSEAMNNSLWAGVQDELIRLRKIEAASKKSTQQKGSGTDTEPVLKGMGGSAAKGPTMKDLIKIYGSEEAVYQAFEANKISEVPTS